MKLIRTKFRIDDGPIVEGYVEPHRPDWNGWAMPWFTKAQVEHMMAAYDTHNGELASYHGHFEVEGETTKFVVSHPDDGGEPEVYVGEEHPELGLKVYPIGAGAWMWEEVPEMGTWLPIRTAPRDGTAVLTDAGLVCWSTRGFRAKRGSWVHCDVNGDSFRCKEEGEWDAEPDVWTPFTPPTVEETKEINKS